MILLPDDVRYVKQDSPNPSPPYTTEDTAGHDIQSVLDVCVDGDTVWVYPGTYNTGGAVTPGGSLSNRVCLTREVLLQSTAGYKSTFIYGGADATATNGPGAVRGVYIGDAATLSGFTVRYGRTLLAGDSMLDQEGGGILVNASGAVVTNCTVEYCACHRHGAGIYAYPSGIFQIAGCLIRYNSSEAFAGGAYLGNTSVSDCSFLYNTSPSYGGGVYLATGSLMENCSVRENTGYTGGGIVAGSGGVTVSHVSVIDNSARTGGGFYCNTDSIVDNCLVAGNSTPTGSGGGAYLARGVSLLNCTVVSNSAHYRGDGVYVAGAEVSVQNTIMYDNGSENVYVGSITDTVYQCCCTTPLPGTGTGNISGAPIFADAAAGDFSLTALSPGVDAGTNDAVSCLLDLAENARVMNGRVDIGCYEMTGSEDLDGDSLNDSIEAMRGTSPNSSNTDGDAMSDYEEYIADTDGADAADWFCIDGVTNGAVYFRSSADRQYTLYSSTNLVDDAWAPVQSRRGHGGADSMQGIGGEQEFYKLNVEIP